MSRQTPFRAIDVSTTNQVTTITSKQLQQLPLSRTAEDIAMLAPGVNMGSPELTGGPLGTPINVFGGASTAENAYYVDGMNVTEALNNQGGVTLPYGAIEQQQTFTSGYDAKYGRSIGGVINQIGKSGSNEWHFGARALWQPGSLRAAPVNYYFANPLDTDPGNRPGDLAVYRKDNGYRETIYDAYVSGPLIKDKLFFFLGAEKDDTNYGTTTEFAGEGVTSGTTTVHDPKLYAKLNWNINDSNVLTLTGLKNSHKTSGTFYDFDYDTLQRGDFASLDPRYKTAFNMWAANYTSYITDDLTLNATVGRCMAITTPINPPTGVRSRAAAYRKRFRAGSGLRSAGGILQFAEQLVDRQPQPSRVDNQLPPEPRLQAGRPRPPGRHRQHQLARHRRRLANTGPGYEWIYGRAIPASRCSASIPTFHRTSPRRPSATTATATTCSDTSTSAWLRCAWPSAPNTSRTTGR